MRRLSYLRYIPVFALCAALSPSVQADVVAPIAEEARIASNEGQTFTFTIAPEHLQRALALSLLVRLDHEGLAGSTYAMRIQVNGTVLDGSRLLNKPRETQMLNGQFLDWFGQGMFRVVYSPDYEAANRADHPMCLVGGKAYEFVLAVSDLVHADENTVVISHGEPLVPRDIVLRDIAVIDAPERVRDVLIEEDPDGELPLIAPRTPGPVDYEIAAGAHGGLLVHAGDSTFHISSGFSFPNVGFNTLGEVRAEGEEPNWEPTVTATQTGFHCTAQGAHYRLERRVIRHTDHVRVYDRLVNLTGEDLHIGHRHMISTAGLDEFTVYLQGLQSLVGQGYQKGGDNPTVFVHMTEGSVGVVAEDDVLRAQCAQVAVTDPSEAGLVNNYFMLPPNGEYELRWSVYPLPQGDYYDFVNAVRRNWDTNFTIPGPFAFPPHPTQIEAIMADVGAWLENASLAVVSLAIPRPEPAVLAHGLAFLHEPQEQQRLKAQAEQLRALKPDLQVLQYLHVYITRMDEAVEIYRDARHIGSDGEQVTYGTGRWWKPTFWLFLPTVENAYGQEMRKTFDLCLDELGFDGIYWDELSYSKQETAYGIHDGFSALPDMATRTVQEKIALTPLHCQAFQEQQVKRVLDAGKILIANGQPVTETMTQLKFPRFVEAWHPSNLRRAHLYSPVGLSSPDRINSEADIIPNIRDHLHYGGLWYYYANWERVKLTRPTVTRHMYPFTPVELHSGYIIGKERIITARSGRFGWADAAQHRVYVYDTLGNLLTDHPAPHEMVDGNTYTALRLPPGGVAVIERVE